MFLDRGALLQASQGLIRHTIGGFFTSVRQLGRAAAIAKLIVAEAAFPLVPADFTEGRSAERRGVWGVAAK
jgi:hypothetical protein